MHLRAAKSIRMDGTMDAENQNTHSSYYSSPTSSSSSSSPESLHPYSPTPGTIIPNRVFVGGIDQRVNEGDLRQIFSQYGAVKEVKIVMDRSGISKRYAFVTYETQEDVLRVLGNAHGICFKEKKLCIGQAFRKNHTSGKTKNGRMAHLDLAAPHQTSGETFYLTTSTGYPYTYHKGVAYFHCPNMNPLGPDWPPHSQLMLPPSHQPVPPQQPPMYHHYQDVPNNCQWIMAQVATPFSSAMYSQPEYPYQPLDGSSYLPPGPAMEDSTPVFFESTAPYFYTDWTPVELQHEPREHQLFPPPRFHVKSRYRRHMHRKNHYCLPESTETPETSVFPFHAPHVG